MILIFYRKITRKIKNHRSENDWVTILMGEIIHGKNTFTVWCTRHLVPMPRLARSESDVIVLDNRTISKSGILI